MVEKRPIKGTDMKTWTESEIDLIIENHSTSNKICQEFSKLDSVRGTNISFSTVRAIRISSSDEDHLPDFEKNWTFVEPYLKGTWSKWINIYGNVVKKHTNFQ